MTRKPSHPGTLLRNVILPEAGLSVSGLARTAQDIMVHESQSGKP